MEKNTQHLLQSRLLQYNHINFIEDDPISIPHQFSKKEDIEIAGFFAAILAWGNRKSIIHSCKKLMHLMGNSPLDFILNESEKNWEKDCKGFIHRTFNAQDLMVCLRFFHYHFAVKKEKSLETAFSKWMGPNDINVENALNGFHNYFFDTNIHGGKEVSRKKHIAAPVKKSACKRLNMYLRWMVRKDNTGVDFGLWQKIKPAQLIIPLDVHVLNVAQKLDLLPQNAKSNWENAVLLTNGLKQIDKNDPVKFDFALFSLGVVEKF